jgi:hypothetical protein
VLLFREIVETFYALSIMFLQSAYLAKAGRRCRRNRDHPDTAPSAGPCNRQTIFRGGVDQTQYDKRAQVLQIFRGRRQVSGNKHFA